MLLIGEKYPWVKDELDAVRTILQKASESTSADIRNEIKNAMHQDDDLLQALMVLLSARFGSYSSDATIHLAAIVELIYLASRLQVTGFIQYGELYSHGQLLDRCFAGSYLLAECMEQMVDQVEPEDVHTIVQCFKQLVVTEYAHLSQRYVLHKSKRVYLKHIEARSGAIFEMCFKVGAVKGKSSKQLVRQLRRIGYHLGMAHQLIEDLLDIDHDEELMGKTLGINIREGVYPLPVYYLFRELPEETSRLLAKKPIRKKHIQRIIELMYEYGAIDKTRALAQLYIRKVYNEINLLPQSEYKQVVFDTASYLLERRF